MEKTNHPLANNHISVDCVVVGFDGEQLKVLLVKRETEEAHDMKLPGSLIYMDENLDEAAQRVLEELTGLKNQPLVQFKAFGSKNRTKNPQDRLWLERATQEKVQSIVTIAYFSTVRSLTRIPDEFQAEWVGIKDVKELAFDHNQILNEALGYIRNYAELNPSLLFELLPRKFTALQMRVLFGLVYAKEFDVRNFHKKIAMMEYVVPLEERQTKVAHRAARFYKFDRKIYNKVYGTTKSFNK